MNPEIDITTERIDDFPLLLEVMIQLGLPGLIDHHLKRHGLQQGLSWGWIASIWLAHILTESNHRKLPVQAWVRQAGGTIERISGQKVGELDFTDDRLTLLLRRLSQPGTWQAIETELGRNLDAGRERYRLASLWDQPGHHRNGIAGSLYHLPAPGSIMFQHIYVSRET